MILKKLINFLILFSSIIVSGQEIPEALNQEILRRTELEINPSISIGLLLPSGEVQFYNYGEFNKSGQKADSLTLYEIGSVTKTFTAFLASKYLQNEMGSSLSGFFPEIQNEALGNISIAQLRNHTSGVPRLSNQFSPENWSDPYKDYSNNKLTEELSNLQKVADSSKSWSYSNFGYGILGRVIEKKTSEDFEFLMGSLLDNIGLNHTFLNHSATKGFELAQPTNIGISNKHWHFNGPSRFAGAIISCAKDLVDYLKFQKQNNEIFSSKAIQNSIPTGIYNLGENELRYKNGWFVMEPDSTTEILIHNGGTGGFTSFVGYNKSTQTGVVVLSNSVSLNDDIGLKLILPEFNLNKPERSIAYDLADLIEEGKVDNLFGKYEKLKSENANTNVIDIYWLERLNFGEEKFEISNQLSDIMVAEIPQDWEAWDIKGQNYEQLEAFKKAEEAYQKAFELNPVNQLLQQKIDRCKLLAN